MKSVQKAFHRELERNWFKVQGPYVKEEKNKERRILSKLPWNPFICGLVDAFHDQQNLYLLLELAPCNSLYEYLYEHGPLPADRVRFYFANLVLALEFIHSHGIVHRDVKPGNILMGADGYLCLTDFGCALEQELDYEWERVGTADYVAPEIRPEELVFRPRGSRNLDARSLPPPEARHMIDWWAAAITLYEMATFKRPFHGEDGHQIYKNIKRQVIPWPEDREIDPDLKDLVMKMLIDDPLKRYGCFVAKEPGEEVGMNDEVRIHPFMWGKVSWKRITERRELAPDVPKPEPDMTQQWQQQGMPMPWHVPGFDLAAVATERAWDNRFEHR
ncbi:kinase-like protein [Laetiporus sulphureus 93-53]|uniref:cAMP-dependent protein kinase n=1 Tax=Laetiporus sulphureus 93-53 TaxID=1314785 RepID=A0A165G317_9APHY|nr:kinase-like protein [Laetiporus sulphureus 93-53]KZT09761.1 kinase-like protein [Laetiporus sulphureus 93-53]